MNAASRTKRGRVVPFQQHPEGVSVVIITKDRPSDLDACLSSLAVQTPQPLEIIIIDSSLSRETEFVCSAYAPRFKRLIYRFERRPGFPIARNLGLSLCTHDWVAFTDDDCVVDQGWIEAILTAIDRHPDAAAIAGRSETYYPRHPVAVAANINETYWKSTVIDGGRIRDLETLDNKNIVYNTSFFRSHGIAYDEQRTSYAGASDDCDLGMQIQKAGGTAWVSPDMVVRHKDPRNIVAYVKNKAARALAHATYERKWEQFRREAGLVLRKPSKLTFFAAETVRRGTPVPTAIGAALVLLLTFATIRTAKAYERLRASGKGKRMAILAVMLAALFGIAGLSAVRFRTGSVSTYRGDEGRTGSYGSWGAPPSWWTVNIREQSSVPPVIGASTVYVTGTRSVYAVDSKTGAVKWTFPVSDPSVPPPVAGDGVVFIVPGDGTVRRVDAATGKELYQHRLETETDPPQPLVSGGTFVYAAAGTRVTALTARTGSPEWSRDMGMPISSVPLSAGGFLFISDAGGKVTALDAANGKTKWTVESAASQSATLTGSGSLVIAAERSGRVRALRAATGTPVWDIALGATLSAEPVAARGIIYIPMHDSLRAVYTDTGKEAWKSAVTARQGASIAAAAGTVYVTARDGEVYALDARTGKRRWDYREHGSAAGAPAISGSALYMVTSKGYLRALDARSGSVALGRSAVEFSPRMTYVPRFGVAEFSVMADSSPYDNPQTEMSVMATFVNKTKPGNTYKVRGFFYDRNEWRVRFSPPETGEWEWSITAHLSPTESRTGSGEITCTESDDPGPVRTSKSDPYVMVDARGKLVHAVGIGDVIQESTVSGTPFDSQYVDERKVTLDTYLKTYADAGFNFFRWSVDNASFLLTDPSGFTVSRPPPVKEGMWGDELVTTLKRHGFRIVFTLYGNRLPYQQDHTATGAATLQDRKTLAREYVQYAIARYGAYADVLELFNEANPTKEWLDTVLETVREEDPYGRLTATSYEIWTMLDKRLTLTTPHWYINEPDTEADTAIAKFSTQYLWGKPLLIGEQGNKYLNWDEGSAERMRIRVWTGFFYHTGIIFWNTSWTKTHRSPSLTSNIYLGLKEREYIRAFRSFADTVGPQMRRTNDYGTLPGGIRHFTLESPTETIGYLHHYADHTTPVTASVPVVPGKKRTVQWIDTQTGKTTSMQGIPDDAVAVESPAFPVDLAYRVRLEK